MIGDSMKYGDVVYNVFEFWIFLLFFFRIQMNTSLHRNYLLIMKGGSQVLVMDWGFSNKHEAIISSTFTSIKQAQTLRTYN